MSLSEKQQNIYDYFFETDDSIFISGPGGCGKSYLFSKIYNEATFRGINIGVTATSASAAILIGGRTIHSFLKIGLAEKSAEYLADQTKRDRTTYRKLRELEVLAIDEISMLSKDLLEKISKYLSILRGNSAPFGGLRVVFLGDFCQLPPVGTGEAYCFKSEIFEIIKTFELTENIRQRNDMLLQKILNKIRWGKCSQKTLDCINGFDIEESDIEPTILYTKNVDIDNLNSKKFEELVKTTGVKVHVFTTKYGNKKAEYLKFPSTVKLAIGAQAVVTWNICQDAELINGTRGIIVNIIGNIVYIKTKNGQIHQIQYVTITPDPLEPDTTLTYMPLRLAYAITIHKSQGMTLDSVIIDMKDIFEYGQAYVALSRVRDSKSLKVLNARRGHFKTHPDVLEFYQKIESI